MGADASVIVCAFNEEDHIGQLLEALTGDAGGIECKIIVVCNGCQDRTPDIARSFPGVIVEEIADASKHQALNVGDRLAGDVFPRLYADADITIDQQSITRLLQSLNVRRARAVAPSIYYRTTGKPWLVRSYYSTWPRIPNNADWASRHIAGRGVYGTNREGRTRFTDFPPLRADDYFFDLLFDESERITVDRAMAGITVPNSTRQLLRSLTRVRYGNLELKRWFAAYRPDQPIRDLRGEGTRHTRLRRLASTWLSSPLLAETLSATMFSYLLGYIIVEASARINIMCYRLTRRDVPWR
jgi:glycosyltransferase involved in cell wall biosynthesis